LQVDYLFSMRYSHLSLEHLQGASACSTASWVHATDSRWTPTHLFKTPEIATLLKSHNGGGLGLVALLVFKTSVAPNPC
ncbi:MAG TPA: hypothetical protein VEH53_01885, partial [archaeon]|nr:hypothetical protein [archaeon]